MSAIDNRLREKWWKRFRRVQREDEPRLRGYIVHVLPSDAALVSWDGLRDRFYVGIDRLVPIRETNG